MKLYYAEPAVEKEKCAISILSGSPIFKITATELVRWLCGQRCFPHISSSLSSIPGTHTKVGEPDSTKPSSDFHFHTDTPGTCMHMHTLEATKSLFPRNFQMTAREGGLLTEPITLLSDWESCNAVLISHPTTKMWKSFFQTPILSRCEWLAFSIIMTVIKTTTAQQGKHNRAPRTWRDRTANSLEASSPSSPPWATQEHSLESRCQFTNCAAVQEECQPFNNSLGSYRL